MKVYQLYLVLSLIISINCSWIHRYDLDINETYYEHRDCYIENNEILNLFSKPSKNVINSRNSHSSDYYQQGLLYYESKQLEKSLDCFIYAMKYDENQSSYYMNAGSIEMLLKHHKNALKLFYKAYLLSTNEIKSNYNLGVSLQSLDEIESCIEVYLQTLALFHDFNPSNEEKNENIIRIRQYLSSPMNDIKIQYMSTYINTIYNLGLAFQDLHDLTSSLELYNHVISLKSDHLDARINYCNVLFAIHSITIIPNDIESYSTQDDGLRVGDNVEKCYLIILSINPYYIRGIINLASYYQARNYIPRKIKNINMYINTIHKNIHDSRDMIIEDEINPDIIDIITQLNINYHDITSNNDVYEYISYLFHVLNEFKYTIPDIYLSINLFKLSLFLEPENSLAIHGLKSLSSLYPHLKHYLYQLSHQNHEKVLNLQDVVSTSTGYEDDSVDEQSTSTGYQGDNGDKPHTTSARYQDDKGNKPETIDGYQDDNQHTITDYQGDNMDKQYITELFDSYAYHFENNLINELNYTSHLQIIESLERFLSNSSITNRTWITTSRQLDILDIGAGTGLLCLPLKMSLDELDHHDDVDRRIYILGIDLSSKMLYQARKKDCYNETKAIDIIEYLDNIYHHNHHETTSISFNIIVAADVLVYFSSLSHIFMRVYQLLENLGLFCFTIEDLSAYYEGTRHGFIDHDKDKECTDIKTKEDEAIISNCLETFNDVLNISQDRSRRDYLLLDSGRYAHTREYIISLCNEFKFMIIELKSTILRYNNKQPVWGYLVLLQRIHS